MDPKLLTGTIETMMLEVLASAPSYGYEIVQTVLGRSGGRFALKEGSLYPALHKLEREKLLESYWTEFDGRRRKYYRLTATGRALLETRRQEWQSFAAGVNGVLGLERGGVLA
ncbi:MAG: helix-turn-helix transcriptional regulator [Singulisphaera sp.]